MSKESRYNRRRFLSNTVKLIAVSPFAVAGSADTDQSNINPMDMRKNITIAAASFDKIKQVDAGELNVGYADEGPANGPVVMLLHGWPYDIHCYADIVPLLTAKGYRTVVPHLRGYGTTRFLSGETLRNGQPGALAMDIIALMDALGIDKAVIAGFDW